MTQIWIAILLLLAARVFAEDFGGRVVAISDGDTITVMHDGRAEKVLTAHRGRRSVTNGWMHTSSSQSSRIEKYIRRKDPELLVEPASNAGVFFLNFLPANSQLRRTSSLF